MAEVKVRNLQAYIPRAYIQTLHSQIGAFDFLAVQELAAGSGFHRKERRMILPCDLYPPNALDLALKRASTGLFPNRTGISASERRMDRLPVVARHLGVCYESNECRSDRGAYMDWLQPLTWDWATLAKSALGAGFGTAAVTGILAVYRDAHHRKSHAAYMAMRLAVILESYAYACSEFISENSSMQAPPDQEFPDWNTTLPVLPPYPDDPEGWRAIDRKLAGRCLNFQNRIHGSQGIISATNDYTVDDLEDTFREHAAARGLEAWTLATALRDKHGVEKADPVSDFVEWLQTVLKKAKASQQDQAERRHEFLRELSAQDTEAVDEKPV